ncbi:MAG: tripartite tricarboxylate transporter substrate binding protein [Spirochaetaceae bacterium]|nr:MAG: tripartite tricarboxylate transporter substrate binding protein [Spirochaetaceae bacterium]
MKRIAMLVVLVALLSVSLVFASGEREYPSRDITNVLVWSAGGGTDTANRIVMAEMAKTLGVNINVVNVTGGVGGSVGMLEAYNRPHDGYTIAGLSESIVTAGVQGGWDKRVDVWDYYIIGGSPLVLSVPANSPHRSIEDLVAAAKSRPGQLRASASAAGSIHHLNLLAFEKGTGTSLNYIPYDGSAPAQNAAITGEVEMVITSIAEQAQLIRAGQLRPLGVLVPQAFTLGNQTIPSAFDSVPGLTAHLPIEQAIGFAMARGVPEAQRSKIREAFHAAMQTEPVKNFGRDNFYVLSGASGDEAAAIFDALESNFAWTLWELGAARVDPQTLGIPRP